MPGFRMSKQICQGAHAYLHLTEQIASSLLPIGNSEPVSIL